MVVAIRGEEEANLAPGVASAKEVTQGAAARAEEEVVEGGEAEEVKILSLKCRVTPCVAWNRT